MLRVKSWRQPNRVKNFEPPSPPSYYFCLEKVVNVFPLVQEMLNLAVKYNKAVQEEDELPPEKLAIANVGRQDAKKHLEEHVSDLMSSNIIQTLGTMLDTVVF